MKLILTFQLIVFISEVILSEKNEKKMKKSHIGNMPQNHSQF